MKTLGDSLVSRILGRKTDSAVKPDESWQVRVKSHALVDEALTRFDCHPAFTSTRILNAAAERFGIANPFFRVHEGVGGHVTRLGGKEFLNFSHYNYLGLNGHSEVNRAASDALALYGTSAAASRLVGGERPVHRELEEALARVYGVEDCIVFVSGHATNVSTISTLFGPKDLILHDAYIHNSALEGIRLSGATRRSFPHNDFAALDALLAELRPRFERTLIVVEGLYSMDGDIADLPTLVEIKRRHSAFLMVDEAHSLGVLGATGRGLGEHQGVVGQSSVDIWMGTMSKTLAGCGGYIAGSQALIDILRHSASGFIYSVGMSPPLAAASLKALQIMLREPDRVERLRLRAAYFLQRAQAVGLNTGTSQGFSVVPVILGSSRKAVMLSNQLLESGINVQPIIHPAVEEKSARLRFFLSAMHSEDDINKVCSTLARLIHGKVLHNDME